MTSRIKTVPLSLTTEFKITQNSDTSKFIIPKKKWTPDHYSQSCFNCDANFNFLFRRRHHCRMCGQLFCSKCSSNLVPLEEIKIQSEEKIIRFCDYCYKIANNSLKPNMNSIRLGDEQIDFEESLQSPKSYIFSNESQTNSVLEGKVSEKIDKISEIVFMRNNAMKYFPILSQMIKKAATNVNINTLEDLMNINQYVKIRRIVYPNMDETKYINGVILKKNVSNRKMKSNFENPSILLVCNSIEMSSSDSQLISFEDFGENERKFRNKIIDKIKKIKPNIIFVEKSINGYIHDFLFKAGITSVQKIKLKLLNRLARFTRAKIVENLKNIDPAKPKKVLGYCKKLYMKNFENEKNKTVQDFIYLDGCNEYFGATISISGPDSEELSKIKSFLKKLLIISRHFVLEKEIILTEISFELLPRTESWNKKLPELPTQGDFRCFLDEKLNIEEIINFASIKITKINLLEAQIENFNDLSSKNEKNFCYIKQKTEEKGLKLKVPFLAIMCGSPSITENELYGDGERSDIALGHFIYLKAKNLINKCDNCKRPRYRHIMLYYFGNIYLKIEAELTGISKNLENKKEDLLKRTSSIEIKSPNVINDKTPIGESKHEIEWEIKGNTSFVDLKSPLPQKESNTLNDFSKKVANMFSSKKTTEDNKSITSENQIGHSDKVINVKTPNHPKYLKIQTYIQCMNCLEILSNMKELSKLYMEYSFIQFLRHFFLNEFPSELEIWDSLESSDKYNCPHYLKCRVFKLDETLVKFYSGYNALYEIKSMQYDDPETISYIEAKEKMILESYQENLKGKIKELIELLTKSLIERKNEMRPRKKSIRQENHNLTSPVKRKDMVELFNKIKIISRDLKGFEEKMINKIQSAINFLEIEKNRMNAFCFFARKIKEINYIDMISNAREKRNTSAYLFDIFPLPEEELNFKTSADMSYSFHPLNLRNPSYELLSDSLNLNNDFTPKYKASISPEKFTKITTGKKTLFFEKEPKVLSLRQRSSSCAAIFQSDGEIKKNFPYYLSQETIEIPNLQNFEEEKKDLALEIIPSESNINNNISGEHDSIEEKQEPINCHINISIIKEEKNDNTENNNLNFAIEKDLSKKSEKSESKEKESMNISEVEPNEDTPDEEIPFQIMNPNNNVSSPIIEKQASNSFFIKPEANEINLFYGLSLGLCEREDEQNDYKLKKFYKFIPLVKNQPLTAIAYALNSAKYMKDVYIKEGFFEMQKIIETSKVSENLKDTVQNFLQKKLFENDFIEKNDEFSLTTILLNLKKPKFPFPRSTAITHINQIFNTETENPLKLKKKNTFLSSFEENEVILNILTPTNKVKIIIYYPRQFEALRTAYGISLKNFIKSLTLSNSWNNSGGKSAASFTKSYDHFFVFKYLKNHEFMMFKSYALEFFKYMYKIKFNQKKSFLSKLFGMFEIHIDSDRFCVIAMENLFFGMENLPSLKIYDLKGSETNRYIANAKKDQVLLDTNFRIDQNGEPLSLKIEFHELLMQALINDTKFLSSHNLVDYSLLLIIDPKGNTIKVGIIDYLRLYTWDKQVESMGKYVINKGQIPTIINPSEYSTRFMEAMSKYFMGVNFN